MTARLVIAGVSSNVGKTTVTVALTHALRARGLSVATFKCGPDYLDPTYHTLASGRPSHNLDGWMMGREAVIESFVEGARGADIALIEGAMGLFDGASPSSNEGSSAEIARWLQAPVLLVLDASGMARSVAALVHGYSTFDPDLRVGGVFANRVGSAGHLALLREASPLVLGGMAKASTEQFRSRHLGLHAADASLDLSVWSTRLEELTDLDAIVALARQAPPLASEAPTLTSAPKRCRIGIAQDAAFSFYYPFNLRLLERCGAELVPFSPLSDRLPRVDGLYFGGGYPELHAPALSANRALHADLHAFSGPIYGECGGLMYLSEAIVTLDGVRHGMAGLIPGEAIMQPKLGALGYVEVETATDTLLGEAGQRFRGHQFRYSRFETREPPGQYRLHTRRSGAITAEGYGRGSVLASYVHAHWASNPSLAEAFVRACAP
ncbi:MAG TPA: cobyrinate a,c-diamide synthase [Polyangiales bacterium]|nr:cobyrinate a,c-diamide synthase [Polyangiales bacterium]